MLARLFEAVVWYETGMFSTHLVDPVSLSYKKLKTILESRGLPYSGLAEKKDVSELVEKSGNHTVIMILQCILAQPTHKIFYVETFWKML